MFNDYANGGSNFGNFGCCDKVLMLMSGGTAPHFSGGAARFSGGAARFSGGTARGWRRPFS